MATPFYKPEHDIVNFTGTHRSAVSQASYGSALFASAFLTYFGTAYVQNDGRPPIVMAHVPNDYAFIGRTGDSALTEQSNIWCIVRYGQSGEHIITYGENEWSAFYPTLTQSALEGFGLNRYIPR
jgi:hypothetical protein